MMQQQQLSQNKHQILQQHSGMNMQQPQQQQSLGIGMSGNGIVMQSSQPPLQLQQQLSQPLQQQQRPQSLGYTNYHSYLQQPTDFEHGLNR